MTLRDRILWLFVGALWSSLIAVSPDAGAENARQWHTKGVEAFQAERFVDAAAAFRRAFELKPTWKLLFNIGQSEAAAGRYGLAVEAFENYLVQGGDEVPDTRREEVLAEIQRIRVLIGVVEVRADDGVELLVDGLSRGETPFGGPVRVAAGKHEATLVKQGEVILRKEVTVAGGMTTILEPEDAAGPAPVVAVTETAPAVEPVPVQEPASAVEPLASEDPEPVAEPIPDPAPAEEVEGDNFDTLAYVSWGIGGAGLVTGAILAGLASSKFNTVVDRCEADPPVCGQEESDLAEKVDTLALGADVFFGVALAGAVAGAVFLWALHEDEAALNATAAPVDGGGVVVGVHGRL